MQFSRLTKSPRLTTIVCVAGKTQSVRIFELLGEPAQLSDEKKEEVALYAEALRHYTEQNRNEAAETFSQLQIKCDNGQLCQLFLDRIEKFRENSPGPNWQGEYVFDSK